MLIDTHCHLDEKSAAGTADAILERARSAGVSAFVVIGVGGLGAAVQSLELAQKYAEVVATIGVHPHDASTLSPDLRRDLEPLFTDERVVAVGEVGLDYHYDHSPRDVQRHVFAELIAIARRVQKPIVVHTREAPVETLELLGSENARDVGGVIHCFSEDKAFARRALDLGFDLSFSGIVTFKGAREVQEVARWAPEDRVLVETDSPYLAPVPLRGKKNEPAFVVHTARHIAGLRGVSEEHMARTTTENACRRFGAAMARAAGLRQNDR